MKIRTDFVTNSSSANFILEIDVTGSHENRAHFDLAVSPETCFSADGDMTAEGISLVPQIQNGEIVFDGKAVSAANSIEELIDLLFSAAVIEGWHEPGDEEDEESIEDEDDFDEFELLEECGFGKTIAVRDAAPKTVAEFLSDCRQAGISPANLTTIVIKNSKSGSGDSAMWIECDDLLKAFEDVYEQQGETRNPDKLQALIDYVMSEPVLPANDNEYCLSGEEPCVWEKDQRALADEMKKLLNGSLAGDHWMCTYADEYTVDVKAKTIQSRSVLYYGSL